MRIWHFFSITLCVLPRCLKKKNPPRTRVCRPLKVAQKYLLNFTSWIVSTVAKLWCPPADLWQIIADKTMEKFGFVFMLYTYKQILSGNDVAFDFVQQRAMDVLYYKKRIVFLLGYYKEKRSLGLPNMFALKKQMCQTHQWSLCVITACQNNRIPKSTTENCARPSATMSHSRYFLELVNSGKFDETSQVYPEGHLIVFYQVMAWFLKKKDWGLNSKYYSLWD